MKHFFLLFVSVLLVGNSCKSQNTTSKKDTVMEKFDINKFKNWEIDSQYSIIENDKYLKKGDERIAIIYFESDSKISVQKSNILAPYVYVFTYDNKSGALIVSGQKIYQIEIGVWKYFNTTGALIKEENMDKPYAFSLKEIIEKIKKEYFIDLEDKTLGNSLSRFVNPKDNHAYYEVSLQSKDNTMKRDYILIDGATGKTLYKTIYYMRGANGSTPFEQYLDSLNENSTQRNVK